MKITSLLKRLVLFTLFTLFIASSILTNAQQQKDVVYLKNGSIVKGTILELIPNGSLKIETADGSLFVYNLDEVEKITKEISGRRMGIRGRGVSEREIKEELSLPLPRGYFVLAKVGPMIQPFEGINIAGSFINGVHINEYLTLGIGVDFMRISGETNLNNRPVNIVVMPVYFDTRVFIPRKRVHPAFYFQMGYGTVVRTQEEDPANNFVIPDKGSGGLFVAFGAGMRILINERIFVLADGGLMSQELGQFGYSSNNESQSRLALKLNMGIGISFGRKRTAQ